MKHLKSWNDNLNLAKIKLNKAEKNFFFSFIYSSIYLCLLVSISFLEIFSIPLGTSIVGLSALNLFTVLYNQSVKNHQSIFGSGSFWFLIGFVLLFLVTPLFLITNPESLPVIFSARDWKEHFWQTQIFSAIAIQSVTSGNYLQAAQEARSKNDKADTLFSSYKSFQYSAFISIVFCFLALLVYAAYLIGTGNPLTALIGTRSQKGLFKITSGGYSADSYLIIIGVLTFWLVRFRLQRKIVKTRYTFCALIILMIPSAIQGNRSYFIYFAVVILIIYLTTGGKVKKNIAIVALLTLPLMINLPRDFRQNLELNTSIKVSQYYTLDSLKYFFTVGDSSMAPTYSILLGEMGENVNFLYGTSYFKALLKPIPRSFFPEKPIEFDNMLNNAIFPSYSRFVKVSFSGLSEPFVNFGLTGIVFFFGILGYISRFLQRKVTFDNDKAILINAWTAGFMFILARGNLSTDIHRLLFPLLPTLIIIKLSKKKLN